MKLLDRFEQSMERMLEGSVGSIFRQKMQPAEIGRALEKAMFEHRQVSVGTSIVPNRYSVALNPVDHAQFAEYEQGLALQLERFLFERATDKGVSVLDHIEVTLVADPDVKRGRTAVTCAISDMHRNRPPVSTQGRRSAAATPRQSVPPAQATQPFRPHQRAAHYVLRAVGAGRHSAEFQLDQSSMTIGRADSNAIVVPDSNVSRYHARIEVVNGVARVEDVGSTNGTWVNGQAVRHAELMPGDRVAFGNQVFEFIDDADGSAR